MNFAGGIKKHKPKEVKKKNKGFLELPYIGCNYNFVDYQKLNPDLKNNTFGYSIGVIMKGTNEKKNKSVK